MLIFGHQKPKLTENDLIPALTPLEEKNKRDLAYLGPQNNHIPLKYWGVIELLRFVKHGFKPLKYYDHMPGTDIIKFVNKDIWNSYFKFTVDRNPFNKLVSLYYCKGAHHRHDKVSDFILNNGLRGIKSFDLYSINQVVVVDQVYKYEGHESQKK